MLGPIVVVPKNSGKIRVCVDYRKLNVATTTDAFPLPFKDGVLDVVVGHEIYSFLDGLRDYNQILMYPDDQEKITFINGLRGYNQIRMHPDGQEKTTFITEWS